MTTRTILTMVEEAEGAGYLKDPYIYEFGDPHAPRRFYEADGPYANNPVGIGYMQIEGTPHKGSAFIVSPNGYSQSALEQWLKENQ